MAARDVFLMACMMVGCMLGRCREVHGGSVVGFGLWGCGGGAKDIFLFYVVL